MTLSEAITELETMIERFAFRDEQGELIPAPIISAMVARDNGERWERLARSLSKKEITPAQYLKEMLEMFENWMRKRFVSNVLSRFADLQEGA